MLLFFHLINSEFIFIGPEHWGDFCDAIKFSQLGQSPIDIEIDSAERANWPRLRVDFKRDRCTKITNNGHSVQVSIRPPEDMADPTQFCKSRTP